MSSKQKPTVKVAREFWVLKPQHLSVAGMVVYDAKDLKRYGKLEDFIHVREVLETPQERVPEFPEAAFAEKFNEIIFSEAQDRGEFYDELLEYYEGFARWAWQARGGE